MKEFRQEIIEAQKKRVDLIQWKLVIVSVLAATGLGLTGSKEIPNSELVLCCIPFACVYADALIHHQAIIINVLGEFLRSQANKLSTDSTNCVSLYEEFALQVRSLGTDGQKIDAYFLERITVHITSITFSLIIAILPFITTTKLRGWLFTSGALGSILAYLLRRAYLKRRELIRSFHNNKQPNQA